jgi:hypothetical protein
MVWRAYAPGQLDGLLGQTLDVRRLDLLAGCFIEQFGRICPHDLVQPEPRLTRGVQSRCNQVVLDQPRNIVEHVAAGRVGHSLRVRESKERRIPIAGPTARSALQTAGASSRP